MDKELENVIEKLREIQMILKKFSSREQAIKFLVAETKLPFEECQTASDILIKIDFKKIC